MEIVLLHLQLLTTNHFHFLIIEEYEKMDKKNSSRHLEMMHRKTNTVHWVSSSAQCWFFYAQPSNARYKHQIAWRLCLTFRNPASYVKDGHTATLNTPHFLYFFNKYTY
jgi:hypothetical protein